MTCRLLIAVLLLALGIPAETWGWGRTGHKVTAQIAARYLNQHAKAEIAELLESGESLDSIASWADEVRPKRPESGPWHYINIPISIKEGGWEPYCSNQGCVVRKIGELVAYLKSNQGDRRQRADALKFLVHFLGDQHQPLHSGDNNDRGGNDVKLQFYGKPVNLHALWDTPLVERLLEQDREFAANPTRGLNWFQRWRMGRGDEAGWSWQAHDVARDAVYPDLPTPPLSVSAAYEQRAQPVVRKQLQRSGVRMAKVLNGIWP